MDSTPTLDPELVKHSISFHGQQLQKIWDSERGDGELSKIGATNFDFSVYQDRQKHLSFQDRAKRLKILNFIARQADHLFDASNLPAVRTPTQPSKPLEKGEEDNYAILPPYDLFLPLDKSGRLHHFFKCVQPGDLLICSITTRGSSGMMLKVLCTDSVPFRYVADLNIKAFCPASEMSPGGVVVDKKGVSRAVMLNEAIRVELLEVVPDSEKMVVSMLQSHPAKSDPIEDSVNGCSSGKPPQLGLVYTEDLPLAYKQCQERKGDSFSELLEQSLGFSNPSNTELLANKAGITPDTTTSFMKSLRGRFPVDEYGQELRQVQASKWAFKSVADGITHFKANRHSEAFQCLNRALSIDRRNVEGLVARGALFANSGSFLKAIEDFENALKLNPNHQNARKYMGETLVALGRSYEDKNDLEEAMKAYESCLDLVPFHEEAQSSIRYLENKMRGTAGGASKLSQDPQAINPSATSTDDLIPGGLTAKSGLEMKARLKQLLKAEQEEKSRSRSKKKKDRKKKSKHRSQKRRHRSSSSSSSSSTASASSSSSSSSSSGSGSTGSSRSGSGSPRRKHRKSKKNSSKESHREKSLSPLSKRMALMETGHDSDGIVGMASRYSSSAIPYSFEESASAVRTSAQPVIASKEMDYGQRVKSFLEQTKGESNLDDKIRKFIEETSKWKKEQKAQEKESKKKKKKEKKQSKEKDKGKKKKSKEDDKRRKRRSQKSDMSGFADELEMEDGGRRMIKEALLAQQMTIMSKSSKPRGTDSSSEDQEKSMVFTSMKKNKKEKSSDISRMISEVPDLDDLESKLKTYFAKVEKAPTKKSEEKERKSLSRGLVTYPSPIGKSSKNNVGLSLSPPKLGYHMELDDLEDKKQMDLFSESPPQAGKSKLGLAEASNIVSSKWKMQIAPTSSKVRKREHSEKEPWEDVEEKRVIMYKDGNEEGEASSSGEGDTAARRRSGRTIKDSPIPAIKTDTYYTKFRGFRIGSKDDPTKMDPSSILPAKAPPTPTKSSGNGPEADHENEHKRKSLRKSRSRSNSSRSRGSSSGSEKRRRRSRSRSFRPRSRSGSLRYGSRSRSRSMVSRSRSRSRSRSYNRSRSRSGYSRSRSGSRERYYRRGSRSPDRYRRYDHRAQRFQRGQRGTYYRPRFQNYKNPRGNYNQRGGRGYVHRGGRPFVNRGRGRGRPRFFHYHNRPSGYRPDHHRRSRSRSDDRRSYEERDRSGERDRERDRDRERYRKEEDHHSDDGGGNSSRKREREPPSDREPREEPDYSKQSSGDYIDRKMFEGKWAEDKDDEKRRSEGNRRSLEDIPPPPGTSNPLPENSIEEMDKFLNKVKAQKKEEMKERNKSFSKGGNW